MPLKEALQRTALALGNDDLDDLPPVGLRRREAMSEVGENGFWHTTRPHDDECEILRAKGATACIPGCRVGQPWPTVRLLPSDREKAKKLREYMSKPRELQPQEDRRAR